MEKSIEEVWDKGFIAPDSLMAPRINNLYEQKSKHIVTELIDKMRKEIWFLVPISVFPAILNVILGNHFIWSIIIIFICIPWFFIARNQYREIKDLDFNENCYAYLKKLRLRLRQMTNFNKKLSVWSVPIILLPMLIYTYFNNSGKTLGEVVGNEALGGSMLWIFSVLPILTLFAYLIFELTLRLGNSTAKKIDQLLYDMEELRTIISE